MKNKYIIIILSVICSFLLGSCTIIITETLRNNTFGILEDTTGYYVPNAGNYDYAFANIDSMINQKPIYDSAINNEYKLIDSILKNSEVDSAGQVKIIDTLTDSTGKQLIRETIYGRDIPREIKRDSVEIIKVTQTSDAQETIFKTALFKDIKGNVIGGERTDYNNDGTGLSASVKKSSILGVIPWVKDLKIQQFEYGNTDSTSLFDYTTTLTNLDDSYYPDSIILNITIQNQKGEFISGLAPPYIAQDKNINHYWKYINEVCKDINDTIYNFKVEEIRDVKSQKNNICFVLDHSGSMGEERCMNLQQAVYYVSGLINENDYLSAIKFTDKAFVEVIPTNDKKLFRSQFKLNGMDSKLYGGGTDILRAIDTSISVLLRGPVDYNRIVVLFTDGESNMNRLKDVIKSLINNKCRVFTICYGKVNMMVMKRIAKETFGKTYKIRDVRDFADVFKEIYYTLTNYYRVVYVPPVCADLHSIAVGLELPIPYSSPYSSVINSEYDKSILSDYAEVGSVAFYDIEFGYNSSLIDSSSLSILLDIASQLKRNSNVYIEIAGHTDDLGSDDYNQKLSLARANSVRDFLVNQGINKNRISCVGYGKSRPIVSNDSEENRRKNRRTEFKVVDR